MKRSRVARTLWRFSFSQTIRGAIIIGILGGLMMGAYGSAIVKVYPTEKSREDLVQTLKATPAINFLSGEVKDAGAPASYSIYKSLPTMVLLTSIWGLVVATRLLRGNEEDGRTELLESGATTRRHVAIASLGGFGCSFFVGMGIMWGLAAILGMAPGVGLSASQALYMTLAVFLPGVVFAAVGALTSQLALTRSRAVFYGIIPLLIFFAIRGVANTTEQLNWLKILSPFGWSDLMDSVLDPHPIWIIPSLITTVIFVTAGLYFVSHRDYGTSLLAERSEIQPRYYLLKSPLSFAIRMKRWTYFWWFIGAVLTALFMAALAGLVSNLLNDSSSFAKIMTLSSDQIKLLFIGESFMIVGMILLTMIILELGSIRRDEAKLYLDNILVQPISRTSWIIGRLALTVGASLIIAVVSTFAIWSMAQAEGIDFGLGNALNSFIAVTGGIIFVGGIGTFLYGLWPRASVIGTTIVVGWSFVVDILKSLLQLDSWIEKTSVLNYIPIDASKSLEWTGIVWMIGLGVVFIGIGIIRFSRRDIISE